MFRIYVHDSAFDNSCFRFMSTLRPLTILVSDSCPRFGLWQYLFQNQVHDLASDNTCYRFMSTIRPLTITCFRFMSAIRPLTILVSDSCPRFGLWQYLFQIHVHDLASDNTCFRFMSTIRPLTILVYVRIKTTNFLLIVPWIAAGILTVLCTVFEGSGSCILNDWTHTESKCC